MTNPTTPYISSYADQIYLSYSSAIDSDILSIKSQFTSAGAYGSSRMYVSIGEAILSRESTYYADLFGAVKYYQNIYDITVSEVFQVYKVYADKFTAYTNSLGSLSLDYANKVTATYNNQLPSLIALTIPWVVISSNKSTLGVGDTAVINFHLSEASTTFEIGDILVTGGALSQFSGSSADYYATFTPNSKYNGTAQISVSNEKFYDLVGNPNLDAGYNPINLSINTSVVTPDTTPPTALTFNPADEATAVAVGSNIVVTFSENIQRGAGNIVLKKIDGTTVATNSQSSTEVTVSGSTLTINPAADLSYSTSYKVEFAAGSVQDLAGNSYSGTTSYNFTTGAAPDTTPPTALTFSPADEATAVAVGSNIVVTFSENIQRGAGNIVLKKADGTVIESYAQSSSNIATSGSTLTINPTSDLAYSSDYFIDISDRAVQDLAQNNFQGASEYNFTTAAVKKFTPNLNLPEVISLGIIQGKSRYLVNPIQFEDGKIYYFLDANGDGKNSYVPGSISTYYLDSVSHDFLDNLLNFGADTFDTQPNGVIYGIDDARTIGIGSLYLSLPTVVEFSASFGFGNKFWRKGSQYSTSDSIPVPGSNTTQSIYPTIDWNVANGFWLATKASVGHYSGRLDSGSVTGDNPYVNVDTFQSSFALFQVLFPNNTPVTYNANVLVSENVSKIGMLSGTDVDGNTLTFAKVADPSHGIVTINSGTGAYTYTPTFNYNGSDSFTFKVNDGTVDSAVATVSITVDGVNDAPVGTAATITTDEDTPATGTLAGTDLDGNKLTFAKVADPSHGTVSINATTGAYKYTPVGNYNGSDSFTFKVNDGTVDSAVATVSITVAAVAEITGHIYHWKSHSLLQDVQISNGTIIVNTDANGNYHLNASSPIADLLMPTLAAQNTVSSIDISDALAALKIAVGLNPNIDGSPVTPYQYIAADVNEDGAVTSADALAIYKMALARADAPQAKWLFVDEAEVFWNEAINIFTTSRKSVIYDKSIDVNTQSDVNANLVAVLKGDVNGSWAPPAGTPNLVTVSPNYFAELATRLGSPQSQWGVIV